MILQTIKKNKAHPNRPAKSRKRGFVLLFAIVLSSIVLSIAIGVANIAYKEIRFGTSVKDTNDAFFAADTGVECALFYDKPAQNKFPIAGPATSITCATVSITPTFSEIGTTGNYVFTLTGIGGLSKSCAKVTINKTSSPSTTRVISKGYNDGGDAPGFCIQGPNSVERQLELNY